MSWVSVKDHMPEEDSRFCGMEQCPVVSYDVYAKTYHYSWRWKIDGVWKWCPAYQNHRITHWFCLPEPPSELELIGEYTTKTEGN